MELNLELHAHLMQQVQALAKWPFKLKLTHTHNKCFEHVTKGVLHWVFLSFVIRSIHQLQNKGIMKYNKFICLTYVMKFHDSGD